jgi:type II secretory pathway component PulF
MTIFIYKAKNQTQGFVEGKIEAQNESLAVEELNRRGCFPFMLEKDRDRDIGARKNISRRLLFKIRSQDITLFTRQFSDLLYGGVPIVKALRILEGQTGNRELKIIIENITKEVEKGESFSNSLKQYPKIFSNLFVSLIKSGEMSGHLEEILANLADFREKEEEIKSKLRSAMVYPILVVSVGIATIIFLFLFVIPRLVTMFEDLGQVLPLPTRILVETSKMFVQYWWAVLLLVGFLGMLFKRALKTEKGKKSWSLFKLHFPFWGKVINKIEISRFARTTGMLLENGVPILAAVHLVKGVLQNELFRLESDRIYNDLVHGTTMSDSLKKSSYFPDMVVNMVKVGEESNTLHKSLNKIANSYEKESDRVTKMSVTLLEPLTILIMGLVIGFIVIAILLPIFEMNVMM